MAADDGFTPLNLISDERDDWKVRVKVFLVWKQTYIRNPSTVISMDTILMDKQGNKILASIKKFLIPEFEDTLKEGNFVDLTEFGVEGYKGDYRLIDHNWKINLLGCSKVRRCPSFEPATNGYNVENFDNVLTWNVSNIFGFDVVGELFSINPMRIKKEYGIESKKIEFKLQDIEGKKIDCNIWGEHAMKLHQYMANNKGISDRIVIIYSTGCNVSLNIVPVEMGH